MQHIHLLRTAFLLCKQKREAESGFRHIRKMYLFKTSKQAETLFSLRQREQKQLCQITKRPPKKSHVLFLLISGGSTPDSPQGSSLLSK